ncbi:hypothetical protein SAMN05216535_3482 [Stutzerimonas xanthomarina]|uniref:Uncharacterized protein n=2 Tax=Stutzerimonas xanthomarina TaxID=271420 RepID=A0A1M5SSD6_9GAMM|nr:hypothetical protein SAMN05216535_3482 [Stutzerimonas xanthomarina]SHH40843.1 hypothetical protein SAMN02744645_3631 [Stutzerimonas xanthomarina DSM 18231]
MDCWYMHGERSIAARFACYHLSQSGSGVIR